MIDLVLFLKRYIYPHLIFIFSFLSALKRKGCTLYTASLPLPFHFHSQTKLFNSIGKYVQPCPPNGGSSLLLRHQSSRNLLMPRVVPISVSVSLSFWFCFYWQPSNVGADWSSIQNSVLLLLYWIHNNTGQLINLEVNLLGIPM